MTIGTIIPPPSLLVPPVEFIDVQCGETREIKLYNNTCANESEVTFNGTWARIAWNVLCTAGGSLDRTGTIPHYTGSKGSAVHQKLQTLTYTAPSSIPNCFTTPTDVVRAEARGFTRDLLIRVSCGLPQGQAATPTLSPPGGTFIDTGGSSVPVKVNAFTSTPGATIRITTDGSDPGATAPAGGSVDLPNNLTTTEQTIVKARAFRDDLTPSGVAQQAYVIKAAVPSLSPPGGTFAAAPTVAITSSTPGGQIRFTLDGSIPTTTSTPYAGPFTVDCGKTLTAAVFKDRVVRSDPASGTYSCTSQTSCPGLVGVFLALFTVDSDPGGHAPFLILQSATLTSSISLPNLTISGNHPSTVTGTGPLNTATCTGSATGTGVIAGFPAFAATTGTSRSRATSSRGATPAASEAAFRGTSRSDTSSRGRGRGPKAPAAFFHSLLQVREARPSPVDRGLRRFGACRRPRAAGFARTRPSGTRGRGPRSCPRPASARGTGLSTGSPSRIVSEIRCFARST